MPEVPVICWAQYLTVDVGPKMCRADFAALAAVKAVKGLPLGDLHGQVPTGGRRRVRIDKKNPDEALNLFAKWASKHVDELGNQKRILIPVPGSQVTTSHNPDFRTAQIAESIRQECDPKVEVSTCLRFKKPMPKSRCGGSRNSVELYENMVIVGEIPDDDIVLVDDVYTSGAHARAAAQRLSDEGGVVLGVVCCGRTCREQLDDRFNVKREPLYVGRCIHCDDTSWDPLEDCEQCGAPMGYCRECGKCLECAPA